MPASTITAAPIVHQVAARLGMPKELRSRAVSGCSSAVSSSAARHGSTTRRSVLATRKRHVDQQPDEQDPPGPGGRLDEQPGHPGGLGPPGPGPRRRGRAWRPGLRGRPVRPVGRLCPVGRRGYRRAPGPRALLLRPLEQRGDRGPDPACGLAQPALAARAPGGQGGLRRSRLPRHGGRPGLGRPGQAGGAAPLTGLARKSSAVTGTAAASSALPVSCSDRPVMPPM